MASRQLRAAGLRQGADIICEQAHMYICIYIYIHIYIYIYE